MYEISSKLITKTLEQRHWRRFGVFIVNFEQVSASWVHFLINLRPDVIMSIENNTTIICSIYKYILSCLTKQI